MKIVVDSSKCQGHAQCHATAEAVYPLDDEGYVAITELEVAPELEELARRGAAACPERAISLEG